MDALSADLRALVNQNAISLEQAAGMMPLPNNNTATNKKGKPRPIIIPTPSLRLAIARAILCRVGQLLPMLLPDAPEHDPLYRALDAAQQPLLDFLLCEESACVGGPAAAAAAAAAEEGPAAQARRLQGQQPHQQQALPPPSAATALVFSAVNNNVVQQMLLFLPPDALSAIEQASHFFRGLPPLPALPEAPPSRVALAVQGAIKAAGLERQVTRREGEAWGQVLRFVQRPVRRGRVHSGGDTHALLTDGDGALWSMGAAEYGQTGHGNTETLRMPAREVREPRA